jgi:choline dehydrogenase-like flavoprotein
VADRTVTLHDDDVLLRIAPTREALHAAILQLYEQAKTIVGSREVEYIDNDTGEVVPREYRLIFGESRDGRSLRQNRFYFGPVLTQIAEQAPGHWTKDAWHELFKREILGFEVLQVKVAGRKRPTTIRRIRSTTGLSVKQMSDFIEAVLALASTTLGVVFQLDPIEREAVRHRAKKRALKALPAPVEEAVPA